MVLSTLLQYKADRIVSKKHDSICLKFIESCMNEDKTQIVKNAIRANGFYLDYIIANELSSAPGAVSSLVKVTFYKVEFLLKN